MSLRKLAPALIALLLAAAVPAFSNQAQGRVCVWSCQCSPNGVCAYWFAPLLSSCPVTQCTRAGGSPSGTPCTPPAPDIPGVCQAPPPQPASEATASSLGNLAHLVAGGGSHFDPPHPPLRPRQP
ncbi:MAG: hypothetical protein WAM82_18710 [Thermoanaerobaculia bacterium]